MKYLSLDGVKTLVERLKDALGTKLYADVIDDIALNTVVVSTGKDIEIGVLDDALQEGATLTVILHTAKSITLQDGNHVTKFKTSPNDAGSYSITLQGSSAALNTYKFVFTQNYFFKCNFV